MTFKAFLFGLLGTFGFPWLLVVVIPFATMRDLEPVRYDDEEGTEKFYTPKRDGRITEGSQIYGQEGCYQCHTQVIRPSYAGNDVFRDGWAGLRKGENVDQDTRRETLAMDFEQEEVAHVGQSRVGPDLSNFGRRLAHHLKDSETTPEEWVLMHLYHPKAVFRYDRPDEVAFNSTCPPKGGLFREVDVHGAGSRTLPVEVRDGKGIIPTDRARALASYLTSLKKDTLGNPLPDSLNFAPQTPANDE